MERLRGIVLRTVKYGENGYIVDMFTDCRGRMSFVAKRSSHRQSTFKAGRVTPSLLLPLSLVEFDTNIHGQERLPSAKAIQSYHAFRTLHFDSVKVSIVLFVAECLSNLLREEGENKLLYQYIEDSLKWFDYAEKDYMNFHIVFLMRLTRFLGIYPNTEIQYAQPSHHSLFYDLMNSEYCSIQPVHQHYLQPNEAKAIPYLLYMDYANMHLYRMNRHQRRRCLEVIIEYYMLHFSGFREPKSLTVLQDVFE